MVFKELKILCAFLFAVVRVCPTTAAPDKEAGGGGCGVGDVDLEDDGFMLIGAGRGGGAEGRGGGPAGRGGGRFLTGSCSSFSSLIFEESSQEPADMASPQL